MKGRVCVGESEREREGGKRVRDFAKVVDVLSFLPFPFIFR